MTSTKGLSYYLGLKYRVELQEREGGQYFVTHPDLDGCMAQGETLRGALDNLNDAKELWVSTRLDNGYEVPEPSLGEEYSGKVSLRMTSSLHSQLADLSERQGISLNLLINTVLSRYAGGANPLMDIVAELKTALNAMAPSQEPSTRANPRPFPIEIQPLASSRAQRDNVVQFNQQMGGRGNA